MTIWFSVQDPKRKHFTMQTIKNTIFAIIVNWMLETEPRLPTHAKYLLTSQTPHWRAARFHVLFWLFCLELP